MKGFAKKCALETVPLPRSCLVDVTSKKVNKQVSSKFGRSKFSLKMSDAARPNRAKLAEFYGPKVSSSSGKISDAVEVGKEGAKSSCANPVVTEVRSPLDINSPFFDSELYSQKVIKEASLAQLMAQEGEIVRQIHGLDSDMQTLVYENYNKFIAATDTIKKMRVDFRDMEEEMDQLAAKMKSVTAKSANVNDALKGKRAQVAELSSTHALLKKLQFLFELPSKLNGCIEEENWALGVKFYVRAQKVLDQYQHVASFSGIKDDCDRIMFELRDKLSERLRNPDSSPQEMAEYIHLLLQLNEPAEKLSVDYLSTSDVKLRDSLESLARQVEVAANSSIDILEFVDHACNGFLSDLCLVIGSFIETFNVDEPILAGKLNEFVLGFMQEFFDLLKRRMIMETNLNETALLIRALDRFYRRLQATCRLMPVTNASTIPNAGSLTLSKEGMTLILDVAKHVCQVTLEKLKSDLDHDLLNIRKVLVTPRALSSGSHNDGYDLRSLNRKLTIGLSERLKAHMSNLHLFLDPELTFAVKANFRTSFCRSAVREGVVISHFRQVLDIAEEFCSDDTTDRTVPPLVLLLLSRSCLDLQSSVIHNILSAVDEQFYIDDTSGGLTTVGRLGASFKTMSQMLLNHYARLEGNVLSQMLRKSIETRDWLNSVEPRSVRAVMKRVVEETTSIDRQIGELYEEGSRKARSSDSSRRTRLSHRTQRSWAAAANTSLASNIQKMFNEKIEIFSPVEASKVSILTGIVKIALKTLLECTRLKTFSRFGFQQMQVDVQYLNLYMWRFVSDENLVMFMLDEVMASVVNRCPDGANAPMEQSIVELICDRN